MARSYVENSGPKFDLIMLLVELKVADNCWKIYTSSNERMSWPKFLYYQAKIILSKRFFFGLKFKTLINIDIFLL